MKIKHILLLAFLLASITSQAQYQMGLIPRSSPDKSVCQKVGFTEVEIIYGAPNVKGRVIWGELVPYNKIWRAGANKATKISFSTDVTIQGITLDKGIYAFFIEISDKNEWVGIFNKVAEQWGAFKYDQSQDALRIPLKVKHNQPHLESLSYEIQDNGFDGAAVLMKWGKSVLSFSFEVDYLENFISLINDKAENADINIKWVAYLQGAEHLIDKGEKNDLILDWLNKSEQLQDSIEIWNEQFYPIEYIEAHRIWSKARYYNNIGDWNKAIINAEKLLDIKYDQFYKRNNEEVDSAIDLWNKK